jgi:hypothetical protein
MPKGKKRLRIVMEIEVPNDFNISYLDTDFEELDMELAERHIQDFSDPENDYIEMQHLEITKILK